MHITPTHVSLSHDEIQEAIMLYLNNAGIRTSNKIDVIGILPRAITVSLVTEKSLYPRRHLDLRGQ